MSKPILTISLNAAIDLRLETQNFTKGDVAYWSSQARIPAGKGINVGRAASSLGAPARVILACGVDDADTFRSVVGLHTTVFVHKAQTRINVSIYEAETGDITHLRGRGGEVASEAIQAVCDAAVREATDGGVVCISGSIPPGAPSGTYLDLARRLHKKGAKVVGDSSGPGLEELVQAAPYAIKPNLSELEELLGRAIGETAREVSRACQEVASQGPENVVVSLGAHGAVWYSRALARSWHARPPRNLQRRLGGVGCGDALVGAVCAGLREVVSPGELLRRGVAAGTASLETPMPGEVPISSYQSLLNSVEIAEESA